MKIYDVVKNKTGYAGKGNPVLFYRDNNYFLFTSLELA